VAWPCRSGWGWLTPPDSGTSFIDGEAAHKTNPTRARPSDSPPTFPAAGQRMNSLEMVAMVRPKAPRTTRTIPKDCIGDPHLIVTQLDYAALTVATNPMG
jgi:hypothetical protein